MRVIGGMDVGPDNRIHTTYAHNPSTLRLCSYAPNLTNIPRATTDLSRYVKDMFVAPEGHVFWERDFSGIEARLVGYFSGSRKYTWLTGLDVHSFYTAHALNAVDGRVSANDLPDIEWPEERLRARLKEIKKEFGKERNELYKHLVHGANYLQSPRGAQRKIFKDTGKTFDLKVIQKVMGVYFEIFPEIPKWHRELCNRVDGTKRKVMEEGGQPDPWTLGVCNVTNPFGYNHKFYSVLDWEKINGEWYSSFGEDSKRLVAFLPQSTAAAIIKWAARSLWESEVGRTMRLLIHDSILGECREADLELCIKLSGELMEQPIKELPLDPTWNMGPYLSIGTEPKSGNTWSTMT